MYEPFYLWLVCFPKSRTNAIWHPSYIYFVALFTIGLGAFLRRLASSVQFVSQHAVVQSSICGVLLPSEPTREGR